MKRGRSTRPFLTDVERVEIIRRLLRLARLGKFPPVWVDGFVIRVPLPGTLAGLAPEFRVVSWGEAAEIAAAVPAADRRPPGREISRALPRRASRS